MDQRSQYVESNRFRSGGIGSIKINSRMDGMSPTRGFFLKKLIFVQVLKGLEFPSIVFQQIF